MTARWAVEEMAGADFGDTRLDERAVVILSELGRRPNLSIPAACAGRAEMTAAYRFFDNDKVDFPTVLAPHVRRTVRRLAEQPVALLVQDTTEIELARPRRPIAGVGELDGSRRGLLLHEMQAFSVDATPLGTVHAEVLNRTDGVSQASGSERSRRRKRAPIEDKESFRWLVGLRRARELAQELPGTQVVVIGDSESDIYEILAEPRGERPVDWLIRACQDRALEGEDSGTIRARLRDAPALYTVEIRVRSREAKTAAEDRARRLSRPPREATAEVRAATVALRPPWRPGRGLPPVAVNVVVVREAEPPAGEPPVEWILLTTLPIATPEQVRQIVGYYCVRWGIEVFFRTLKSGCRIERRRFEHVDRILPYLAICLLVSWRTLLTCRLGRECPEMDCEAVFEVSEWKAVWVAVKRTAPPAEPPRLAEVVHLVAGLGGYVERPGSEPGVQTLWIGLQRMYDLAWAWDAFGPGRTQGEGGLV